MKSIKSRLDNYDVLVVDNDKDFLRLVCKHLQENEIHALGTTSAVQSLQYLKEHDFSILITDIKMPKIGGIELIHNAIKLNKDISIIVWTEYGSIEDAVQCI